MRLFVIFLAALSLAAASSESDDGTRQLFSFSFGSPPEGSRRPSSASAPQKQNKGSLSTLLSSFSQNFQSPSSPPSYVPSGDETQNDSPLGPGGDGPGPLHYPEYEEEKQRKKPSRPTSYSNDISSDGNAGFRPGGRRPVSDGYKPGLPPGFEGNYASFSGGKHRPQRPQDSPFSFFRGYKSGRGPPPQSSSSNGSPTSSSYYSGPGQYKTSGSESIPARISRGIMGLFSSPAFSFAMAPFNFNLNRPQRPQQGQKEAKQEDSSDSPTDPATFYLAPPTKDAPSFYRMRKPKTSLKSLFSMESSESNNQRPLNYLYREQSQKGNNFMFGIDPKNMVSPQNQLVMTKDANGKPIVLEVAPFPQKTPALSTDTSDERRPYAKSIPKYRYVSIPKTQQQDDEPVIYDYPSAPETVEGSRPQILTLASQPSVPFPSLTQEEEQEVTPTPKSQYVATISESVSLFPPETYKTIQAAPSTKYVAALLSPPQTLQDVKPSTPQYATILTESS